MHYALEYAARCGGTESSHFSYIWNNSSMKNSGVANILFVQDQTGIDRLEFDIYCTHPQYDDFYTAYNNIVRAEIGNITHFYYFIVRYVKTDIIKGCKHVVAYSSIYELSKVPYSNVLESNQYTLRMHAETSSSAYNITLHDSASAFGFLDIYGTCMFGYPSVTQKNLSNIRLNFNKSYFAKPTTEVQQYIRDKVGIVLVRRNSTSRLDKFIDVYESTLLKDLKNESVKFHEYTITDAKFIKKIEEIDDSAVYYTHAFAYLEPTLSTYNASTGYQTYICRNLCEQQNSTDVQGANVKTMKVDNAEALSPNVNTIKLDIAGGSTNRVEASFNLSLLETGSTIVQLLDTIKVQFPSTSPLSKANGTYIVIESKRYFDRPNSATFKLI